MKLYVVGTHWKCLGEVPLMSTPNIYSCAEVRKQFIWQPLPSGAMIILTLIMLNNLRCRAHHYVSANQIT